MCKQRRAEGYMFVVAEGKLLAQTLAFQQKRALKQLPVSSQTLEDRVEP